MSLLQTRCQRQQTALPEARRVLELPHKRGRQGGGSTETYRADIARRTLLREHVWQQEPNVLVVGAKIENLLEKAQVSP